MSFVECCYGAYLVATSSWHTTISEAKRAAARTVALVESARLAGWDSSGSARVMQSKGGSGKGLFGDIEREVETPRSHSLRSIGSRHSLPVGRRPASAHMQHRNLLTLQSRNPPLDLNDAFLPVTRHQNILAIIRSATRVFQCSGT